MPGSRKNEVEVLLPILLDAAKRIKAKAPSALFTLLKAETLSDSYYESFLSTADMEVETERKNNHEAMRKADLALVCSGTATLECTLFRLPMVVVNRVSWLTYQIARRVIQVKYLATPNLLADRAVVPELIQYDCQPAKISEKALNLLENPTQLRKMQEELMGLNSQLGSAGTANRVADEILKELAR